YVHPNTYGNELIRCAAEIPIYDGAGNQRLVTHTTPTVTDDQVFDAFGNRTYISGGSGDPLQWQGGSLYQTNSQDVGLILAGAGERNSPERRVHYRGTRPHPAH